MAIKPHCVICGFDSWPAGSVEFADYRVLYSFPAAVPPGSRTAEGVESFCGKHLKRAEKLRHLPAAEAIEQIRAGADLGRGPIAWLRKVRGGNH